MTRAPVISNAAGEAHVPVLLEEVVAGLAITQGDTIVDATFGAGGYARALLGAGAGRVIGFDRDPDAIANGPSLVPDSAGGDRLLLIEERFSQMEQALAARDLLPVDGVTMDDVACAAGVGKGTVFRRFGSRAGLMMTLLSDAEAQFQGRFMFGPPPLGPGARSQSGRPDHSARRSTGAEPGRPLTVDRYGPTVSRGSNTTTAVSLGRRAA